MKKQPTKKWTKRQASILRGIHESVHSIFDPPPMLPVWEWAELRRRLGRNVTARPGKYQVSMTPYQQEPQEQFTHPDVQTTVLYWAKRLGKTEMENNLVGSQIEQNPRNILIVYPIVESAKKWSKQFFDPMVKSTPSLRRLVRTKHSKEAGQNTILEKSYPGGVISAIGAKSRSGFRQVQAPVVICDEVDAMEDDMTEDGKGEGDPITRAFGRAENYADSIQVVSSTATRLLREPKEGDVATGRTTGSRIHDWWLKSDQRKWFVKNPCCGKLHVLEWKNVKWPEPHLHEDAWYECPDCQARWDDKMRLAAILAGVWRPTAQFRGIRGYWLNGLNTVFPAKKGYKSKLHQFAAEFYDAYTSGEAARVAWKNTFLCEPHVEKAEQLDANPFYDRLEIYQPDSLPDDVVIVFLISDIQGDRIEYEFIGLGENEETWGIQYGKIQGDTEKDSTWDDFAAKTQTRFKRRDGTELRVDCVAMDHRHKGKMVRAFIKKLGHPHCYPVFGAAGKNKQSLLVYPHKNKKYRITLYSVGTETAKDILFARMKIQTPGPRYMHYPVGCGYEKRKDGYFDQLTAEETKTRYFRGYAEKHYEKIRDRNEALDLRVYFLAAVDILNPAVKFIKAELLRKQKFKCITDAESKQTAAPVPAQAAIKPEPEQPFKRKRFSTRNKLF